MLAAHKRCWWEEISHAHTTSRRLPGAARKGNFIVIKAHFLPIGNNSMENFS